MKRETALGWRAALVLLRLIEKGRVTDQEVMEAACPDHDLRSRDALRYCTYIFSNVTTSLRARGLIEPSAHGFVLVDREKAVNALWHYIVVCREIDRLGVVSHVPE